MAAYEGQTGATPETSPKTPPSASAAPLADFRPLPHDSAETANAPRRPYEPKPGPEGAEWSAKLHDDASGSAQTAGLQATPSADVQLSAGSNASLATNTNTRAVSEGDPVAAPQSEPPVIVATDRSAARIVPKPAEDMGVLKKPTLQTFAGPAIQRDAAQQTARGLSAQTDQRKAEPQVKADAQGSKLVEAPEAMRPQSPVQPAPNTAGALGLSGADNSPAARVSADGKLPNAPVRGGTAAASAPLLAPTRTAPQAALPTARRDLFGSQADSKTALKSSGAPVAKSEVELASLREPTANAASAVSKASGPDLAMASNTDAGAGIAGAQASSGGPAPTPAPAAPIAPSPASAPTPASAPVSVTPSASAQTGIEQSVGQIADLRDMARSARPEMTLRHNEFGSVTVRIEPGALDPNRLTGAGAQALARTPEGAPVSAPADWRAVLSSRDPGFVPAVQAALSERAAIAASEAGLGGPAGHNQPGSGQQQNASQHNASNGASQGFGQNATGSQTGQSGQGEAKYGSSTGGSQASRQPSSGEEADARHTRSSHSDAAGHSSTGTHGALYA